VLDVLRDEPKMCKYLDLPVQHISDNQLSAMKRNITGVQIQNTIDKIRNKVPGITLRTTMIVGYPGESDADFNKLCDFVKQTRFDRLGAFTYSEEEGTYSAENLQDDVPQDEKERRLDLLMELQAQISQEINESKVGKIYKVIVDRIEGEYAIGRTECDSPEVDGEILINSESNIEVGKFYNIKITEADQYDLYGEIVK
jgi:ribosomal protein S12 methylthiotransferase